MTANDLRSLAETWQVPIHSKRLLVGAVFSTIMILFMLHPIVVVAPIACYCIGRVLLGERSEP